MAAVVSDKHEEGADLPKIVAIVGPTASGKTSLAEKLAVQFSGQIVSVDSRQVYKRLTIGSGKEYNLLVAQHLLDLLEPGEKVTPAWYQARAFECIDALQSQGVLPILVGGSMQYLSAIAEGYVFDGPGSRVASPRYKVLTLGIEPNREVLRDKIKSRTLGWIEAGFEQEVRDLLESGIAPSWIDTLGLEYRAMLQKIEGRLTLDEAIEKSVTWQMQYAKRQMTWWRHHGQVAWVDGVEHAGRLISEFLNREN